MVMCKKNQILDCSVCGQRRRKVLAMRSTKTAILFFLLCLTGLSDAFAYGGGHGGGRYTGSGHGYYGHGGGYYGHGYYGHGYGYGGIGVTIGPYWAPWGYPGSYYGSPYYSPVVIEQAGPQIYIEQQENQLLQSSPAVAPVPAPQTNYWYYCRASKGYYPYVKDCPGGWQKVSPQPPG